MLQLFTVIPDPNGDNSPLLAPVPAHFSKEWNIPLFLIFEREYPTSGRESLLPTGLKAFSTPFGQGITDVSEQNEQK